MKTFKIIYTVFFASLLILTSCSKEDSVDLVDSVNEDSIAKELVLVDYSKTNLNARNETATNGKLIIVRWTEWGRKKRNCAGWGLCKAHWFFCVDENNNQVDCFGRNSNSNGYSTPLQFDETDNRYYVDVLLAEPTTIPEQSLTLKIDENFMLDTSLAIGKDLTFSEGDYVFNRQLGEFGGIRVYLD